MKLSKFIFFLAFSIPSILLADSLNLQVISVHDGDTLTALDPSTSERYKVRLMGVDTPEVDFYNNTQGDVSFKARDFLRSLTPEGSMISITDDSQVDKHGRILGRIVVGNIDVNKEILKQGWGVMYFIFPFDKRLVTEYSKASKDAFDNNRGLFSVSYKNTEIPYEFRLRVRKQVGFNPIGDLELKRIFAPEKGAQIPVWKRVFFPDYEMAYQNGYN